MEKKVFLSAGIIINLVSLNPDVTFRLACKQIHFTYSEVEPYLYPLSEVCGLLHQSPLLCSVQNKIKENNFIPFLLISNINQLSSPCYSQNKKTKGSLIICILHVGDKIIKCIMWDQPFFSSNHLDNGVKILIFVVY